MNAVVVTTDVSGLTLLHKGGLMVIDEIFTPDS